MKKSWKHILCILLAVCLLLEPTLYAHAFDRNKNTSDAKSFEVGQIKEINPLYENVLSEEDVENVPTEIPTVYSLTRYTDDMAVIGGQIRAAMAERTETITVYAHVEKKLNDSEYFKQLVRAWFEEAFAETEEPTEGDYLRHQYAGWSAKGKYGACEDGDGYWADVTLQVTYYTTWEQEEEVTEKLETVLWETLDLDDSNLTDYEKTKRIYDYICSNVVYDYEHLNDSSYKLQYTAYGALLQGISVCQGYSVLMYRMMEEVGVDTRVVTGEANGAHGWNISKLGDHYYYLDSTWDAGREEYQYFLKGYENFELDHHPYTSSPVFEEEYEELLSAKDYVVEDENEPEVPEVHIHTYDAGVVTKQPTCMESGEKTYTCAECGEVKTESVAKLSTHKYSSSYTIDKKATTTANGSKSKHCTISGCSAKTAVTTIYKASGVKLSTTTYTYNGKAKNPTVSIKDSKGKTISSTNYKLTMPGGRKNVGKYTYKIAFKNEYAGTKSITFTIKPKATSISKLTKASKAFTVKWKKQSTQVTGYQIQYATNKSFTKNVKSTTIKSYKTTSKKITKLSAKKTYYVRVRTYRTVNGTKYYSSWSGVKSVKTK